MRAALRVDNAEHLPRRFGRFERAVSTVGLPLGAPAAMSATNGT